MAAIKNPAAKLCAVEFHPEVLHTDCGTEILRNFIFEICGAAKNWSRTGFIDETVAAIRRQVGDARARCALSAAALIRRSRPRSCIGAIGDRLTNVFVDTGLLRKNEYHETLDLLRNRVGLNVDGVDASQRFLSGLAGVTDPETKRKIIGADFIAVFAEEARKLASARSMAPAKSASWYKGRCTRT